LQAPHIAVALFARGLLKQLYTRIYFADEAANAGDPVLSSIDDPAVRQTLIATRREAPGPPTYRFDVILQGERETAFFEL
jgi:protocatechuate 3,4-dioxygenase alpha subunit